MTFARDSAPWERGADRGTRDPSHAGELDQGAACALALGGTDSHGTLMLIGGREGIGESILVDTVGALQTRGRLDGVYIGTPRAVIVAATEDSWEYTIVPRLMAAGADLDRVYRVDVATSDAVDTSLSLPRDLLDSNAPSSMSRPHCSSWTRCCRGSTARSTHTKTPMSGWLLNRWCAGRPHSGHVVGLIHVNKSASTDPLTTLMASRAFAAVARSVLFVMADPDDEQTRLLGPPKTTWAHGPAHADVPDCRHEGRRHVRRPGLDRPARLDRARPTHDPRRLEKPQPTSGDKTATSEAADWLQDYLTTPGGTAASAAIKRRAVSPGTVSTP